MSVRVRSLFFGWLIVGASQLLLLGSHDPSARPGIGQRGAETQSEVHPFPLGKRILAEPTHRGTPASPFAPSSLAQLILSPVTRHDGPDTQATQPAATDRTALPPARAPPALS